MDGVTRPLAALVMAAVLMLCALPGFCEASAGDVPSAAPEATVQAGPTEAEAPYPGRWLTFEDGFQLYLPEGWQPLDVSDAQREAGLFYRAGEGGGEASAGLAVGYMAAGDYESIDALALGFFQAGCEDVQTRRLNGIPAVLFERPDDDYRGAAFFHPIREGYILYVEVSPLGGDGAGSADVGAALLDTLSPWPAQTQN